jgi:hypothetical protein
MPLRLVRGVSSGSNATAIRSFDWRPCHHEPVWSALYVPVDLILVVGVYITAGSHCWRLVLWKSIEVFEIEAEMGLKRG